MTFAWQTQGLLYTDRSGGRLACEKHLGKVEHRQGSGKALAMQGHHAGPLWPTAHPLPSPPRGELSFLWNNQTRPAASPSLTVGEVTMLPWHPNVSAGVCVSWLLWWQSSPDIHLHPHLLAPVLLYTGREDLRALQCLVTLGLPH